MKGLIDGLLVYLNKGQIGDYSRNFIDNLLKYKNFDIKILKDYEINNNKYNSHSVEILLDRANDNYNGLTKYLNNNNINFYHCLNNGFSIPKNFDFNYITSISNLMPLNNEEFCSPSYLNNFFNKFPYSVLKSNYIICPSLSCKKEFLNNFSVNEENVFVNYGFVSDFFCETDKFMSEIYIKSKFNIDYKYMIFYGDFNKRKNLDKAILLFSNIKKKIPNLHFLICTDNFTDVRYLQSLKNLCSKLQISNFVYFLKDLDIFDKINLFNNALFFIDLSSYECVNLNIIEAFKCGLPILCSDIDLYKEYFGDVVFYYECNDNYISVINYINNFVNNDYDEEKKYVLSKFKKDLNLKIISNIYNKF